jgi:hypothetical protein
MPDLIKTARYIRADEIVVPDIMGNAQKTIALAYKFEAFAESNMNYMGVVQGKNIAEIIKCATALSFLEYITVLGLPRVLANTIHRDIRVNFCESLRDMYDRQLPIHCLGSSEDPAEVMSLARTQARSIDTSVPFVAAYKKQHINLFAYDKRQKNYFDLPMPDLATRELVEDNVRTYLAWARAEPIV